KLKAVIATVAATAIAIPTLRGARAIIATGYRYRRENAVAASSPRRGSGRSWAPRARTRRDRRVSTPSLPPNAPGGDERLAKHVVMLFLAMASASCAVPTFGHKTRPGPVSEWKAERFPLVARMKPKRARK